MSDFSDLDIFITNVFSKSHRRVQKYLYINFLKTDLFLLGNTYQKDLKFASPLQSFSVIELKEHKDRVLKFLEHLKLNGSIYICHIVNLITFLNKYGWDLSQYKIIIDEESNLNLYNVEADDRCTYGMPLSHYFTAIRYRFIFDKLVENYNSDKFKSHNLYIDIKDISKVNNFKWKITKDDFKDTDLEENNILSKDRFIICIRGKTIPSSLPKIKEHDMCIRFIKREDSIQYGGIYTTPSFSIFITQPQVSLIL